MDYDEFELFMQSLDEVFDIDDTSILSTDSPRLIGFRGDGEELFASRVTDQIEHVRIDELSKSPPKTSSHLTQGGDASSNPSSPDSAKKDRGSSSRTRVTHTDQVRKLEDEITKLTLELQEAQKRAKELALIPHAQGTGASKCTKDCCYCQPMWEAIAKNQRQHREKAETKNAHLRILLELQSRYLRTVRLAIQKQPKRMDAEGAIQVVAPPIYRCELQEARASDIFDSLRCRLNEMYAQADSIWEAFGIAKQPMPSRKCLTTTERFRDGAHLEFITRASLPFGIGAVEKMVWNYLGDIRIRQPYVQSGKVFASRDNTIRLNFDTKTMYDSFEVSNSITCAAHKFTEDSRIVIATITLIAHVGRGQTASEGIKTTTTAIRMLKRGSCMPDGSHATIFESYWSTRAFDVDGETKCPPCKLKPFIEFGVQAMKAVIAQEHEVVEDLLVQTSLGVASSKKPRTDT